MHDNASRSRTNNKLSVRTEVIGDLVVQELDVMGQVTRRFADVAASQMDREIRRALIKLGWTPPREGMNKVQRYLQVVDEATAIPDWSLGHDELLEEADELWMSMTDEQRQEVWDEQERTRSEM